MNALQKIDISGTEFPGYLGVLSDHIYLLFRIGWEPVEFFGGSLIYTLLLLQAIHRPGQIFTLPAKIRDGSGFAGTDERPFIGGDGTADASS